MDLGGVAEFADDAAVGFVDEDDLAGGRGLAVGVAAVGGVVGGVVVGFVARAGGDAAFLAGVGGDGGFGALEESGALREDGFEGIDILLRHAEADTREFGFW